MISLSPLPSVHPKTFQRLLVRTSIPCYRDFILTKGRSQSFASTPTDYAPYSDSLSLRLRTSRSLTSPVTVTRRLIMQKARRHPPRRTPTACRRTVSGTISLPCLGCFSPFPYGTGSLSVSEEYLALPDGAGRFRQDSSGPALLRILLVLINFRLRGYHPLWLRFPGRFYLMMISKCSPTTPDRHADPV